MSVLADEGIKAYKFFYELKEVSNTKMFNWKQAQKLCNLLEKDFGSQASPKGMLDYLDFKETMYMQAPIYGCELESDRAVFMYAMCIDYLKDLDFKDSLGSETLLNELYEVGKVDF